MKIDNFIIDKNSSTFIIAELSANHGHDINIAKETIRAAKRAGADAIKLQTYKPETITIDVKTDDFLVKGGTLWDGRYLFELYQEAFLPWEWHEELFKTAKEEGLVCFSSPFDFTAVDLLEDLNVPAYKIASFEITDIPLIEYVASKGKPVIISTGIAGVEDIDLAVETCINAGNDQIILLKCTSAYPAKIEDANLIMIKDLAEKYNVIAGLSDHTKDSIVPALSVAMGAKVIEKHFILKREIGGPDVAFSLDEAEFTEMVSQVREAEKAMGRVDYNLTDKMIKSREHSRSLYVVNDIAKGEVITKNNVRSIRPGFGLHPKYLNQILGKKMMKDISRGAPLSIDFIDSKK